MNASIYFKELNNTEETGTVKTSPAKKITIARHIPENSTAIEQFDAVVYVYTSEKYNQPAAIAYIGKQSKPFFWSRFLNDEQRSQRIAEFFDSMKRTCEYKQERKAVRTSAHSIKVGDILYASWGYDQTNIDFFQVTAVTAKTVTFGKIAQNIVTGSGGFMCEDVTARKDSFLDDKRYTRKADGENRVSFGEFKGDYKLHLSLYNGRPLYQSHYA